MKDTTKELEVLRVQREQVQQSIRLLEQTVELARRCLEESLKRKKYIEELLSQALSEIYGVPYEFELELLVDDEGFIKGLRPRLRCEGGGWRDPNDNFGAGVGSVLNLFLHLVCLAFVGGTQKFMFFDEPLAHISSGMQKRLESFLRTVCQGLGIQLVMITHQDAPFGKVYVVKKTDRISRIQEVK